ncbi:SDR family NAD(P)-dependent oxidoreductase [Kitasatospora sp. NPDC056138]|uniref:SDR family NAD(P)-dependent oxidoreductase n=1 Tax=Kitasatospora sp. NPDC056138 TaxID=3345724 RepID=UPI0035DCA624
MSRGTVFVTGGSRGIGLEICRALLVDGYTVVAVARQTTPDFGTLTHDFAGRAELHRADLADESDRTELALRIRSCRDLYGLVNNAGVAVAGLHVGMPQADWTRMWLLNVIAPMALCQAAAKSMHRAGVGRIVNVSSISTQKTFRGLGVYTATKSALEGFSRVLAVELGVWGITVNCVAPGFIPTDMNAELSQGLREKIASRNVLNRQPSAQDVARTVLFLLSESAATVTAQVIKVDSGASA